MDGSELHDLATPLSFNGFTRATLEQFGDKLRAIGLEPRQGLSAGRQPPAKHPQRLSNPDQ